MSRLKGKNALVTGASSGIGQAIAIRFAQEGANVAIAYRTGGEQAQTTAAHARAARTGGDTGREIVVQADVSNEEQVAQMFATTIKEFGRLDILVNNAGIQKPAPSHELSAADFDRVISVNLRGPMAKEFWVQPKNYRRFFPKDVPADLAARRAYAGELLESFARRAFRRPVDRAASAWMAWSPAARRLWTGRRA